MIHTIRRQATKLLGCQGTICGVHTLRHDRRFQCRVQQGLRNRRIVQTRFAGIHRCNRLRLELCGVITRRQVIVDGHLTQSWEIPSRIARSQAELDLSKVGNHLANHEEPVILHMNLQIVAEIRALRKQHKVRQRLASGDNLITAILLNAELVLRITHDRHTRRKLPLARKCHRVLDIIDLHGLGSQESHITTDLLEIKRGHRNPRGELRIRHMDAILVAIEKLEFVGGHALLLTVLKDHIEVIGVIPRDCKRKRVVICSSLHDTLKVIRCQTNNELLRRVGVRLLLKLVGKKTEMNQHRAGVIHRHHAESVAIKNQAHLHENTLECLDKSTDSGSLNRLGFHDQIGHSYYHLRGRFMKVVRGSLGT